MYHHIEPAVQAKGEGHGKLTVDNGFFEKQMAHLVSSGYTAVAIDQIVQSLLSHTKLGGKNVAITLDDGYSDAYTYAYPIAKKYKIVLNLMIPTGLLGNPGYVTWNQLKEMLGSGLVHIYNHTWSHANLASANADKITMEVTTAKKQLEEQLGVKTNIFTYPYGASSQKAIDILRQNGYTAALSTNPGFTQCDSFIMSLHRNRIGNADLAAYGL